MELYIIFIFCYVNFKWCGKISKVNFFFVYISKIFIICKVIRFYKICKWYYKSILLSFGFYICVSKLSIYWWDNMYRFFLFFVFVELYML